MLIPQDKLRLLYEQLLKSSLDTDIQGASGAIQIFVTNETDSLCALKMITVKLLT